MGKFKDKMIDDMNGHELQEYLIDCRSSHDAGYIQFLEEELEKAELLINKIKDMANDEVRVTIQDSIASSLIDLYYVNKK